MVLQGTQTGPNEPDVQLALIGDLAPLVVAGEPFVVFELPGEPRAWERPGAVIRHNRFGKRFIQYYISAAEKHYRESLGFLAKRAMHGRAPTSKPVAMLVHAFIGIPESWSWRKKQDARSGLVLPIGTPDFDNLGKVAADSIKGIVLNDDAAVCDGRIIKRYSDKPALRVEVREFC